MINIIQYTTSWQITSQFQLVFFITVDNKQTVFLSESGDTNEYFDEETYIEEELKQFEYTTP